MQSPGVGPSQAQSANVSAAPSQARTAGSPPGARIPNHCTGTLRRRPRSRQSPLSACGQRAEGMRPRPRPRRFSLSGGWVQEETPWYQLQGLPGAADQGVGLLAPNSHTRPGLPALAARSGPLRTPRPPLPGAQSSGPACSRPGQKQKSAPPCPQGKTDRAAENSTPPTGHFSKPREQAETPRGCGRRLSKHSRGPMAYFRLRVQANEARGAGLPPCSRAVVPAAARVSGR